MLVSTCRVDLLPGLRRGYLLHLTNLEDRALEYKLTFVVTVVAPADFSRVIPADDVRRFARLEGDRLFGGLFGSFLAFHVEQPFRKTGGTYTAAVRFRVGAGQTGAVSILPPSPVVGMAGLFGGFSAPSIQRLEGYVTLRLPTALMSRRFVPQPQLDGPARVLLNPETRTLFTTGGGRSSIYDDPPPQNLGVLFGGTADPPPVLSGFADAPVRTIERTEPLHVATGKAENELLPEGLRRITVDDLQYALNATGVDRDQAVEAVDYLGASLVAEQDRAGALVELLCELGDDPELTRAVNRVLEEQQVATRLQASDPTRPWTPKTT